MGKGTISDARLSAMVKDLRDMKAFLLPNDTDGMGEEMQGMDDFHKVKARLSMHINDVSQVSWIFLSKLLPALIISFSFFSFFLSLLFYFPVLDFTLYFCFQLSLPLPGPYHMLSRYSWDLDSTVVVLYMCLHLNPSFYSTLFLEHS